MENKGNEKLKVFTGFAGYGGDKFALQLANIEYEEIGFSEIDKFAIQCHEQNHKGENFGSITEINPDDIPDFDLFTGGFPCQAFSTAGKGQGVDDEKGRGLLFNHIIRICEVKKPKYILLENVKGLMSKKHKDFFDFTQSELKRIGYNIDVTLFNSKNYGIPQNRERVFYVCIRNDLDFKYNKPIPIQTGKKLKTLNEKGEKVPNIASIGQAKRIYGKNELLPSLNVGWTPLVLKDILENEVEDKYFLSEKGVKGLLKSNYMERKSQTKNICATLKVGGDPKCIFVKNATKQGDGVIKEYTNFFIFPRATDNKLINGSYNRVWHKNYCGALNVIHPLNILDTQLKIRKLTPKECFRLMGFLNDQINLNDLSNSQKYKLAGNGWEINLVSKIMRGFLK